MCACWVALSSLRLSARSVGLTVLTVTSQLILRPVTLSTSVSISSSLLHSCPCVFQGRVVENISKRCGGFLRQLSLRGCLSVGDASMKWDSHCASGTHWHNLVDLLRFLVLSVLLLAKAILFTLDYVSLCIFSPRGLCAAEFIYDSIKSYLTVSTCKQKQKEQRWCAFTHTVVLLDMFICKASLDGFHHFNNQHN